MQDEQNKSQNTENQQILQHLKEIHAQHKQVVLKIDELEHACTKQATVAGTVAGAMSGSLTSAMMYVGMELIRMKFGG